MHLYNRDAGSGVGNHKTWKRSGMLGKGKQVENILELMDETDFRAHSEHRELKELEAGQWDELRKKKSRTSQITGWDPVFNPKKSLKVF